jgi:COP9 signalosome complex subunit 2
MVSCSGSRRLIRVPENWKSAQSDFFESFRNYDEAGSLQRIQVLKYLVLTTMLMGSDINPFDSQETKPYKNDPRIAAMTELVDAYQRDDIHQYETILQKNKDLLADPFIAENIDEVTRNMRTKAVVKLVAPYTRFRLDFIAKRLSISIPEVQDIVGFLIMDKKLRGKINQDAGTVEIESRADVDRMQAMADWTTAIRSLASFVLNESDGFKSDESFGGGGGQPFAPVPEALLSTQRSANAAGNAGKRKPNRAPGK